MAKVLNVTSHPIDLSDGRVLAPGEEADDVAAGNRHNKSLIQQGHVLVLDDDSDTAEKPKQAERTAPANTNREDKSS